MKKKLILASCGLSLALGLGVTGCSTSHSTDASANPPAKSYVTGSYIPQDTPTNRLGNGNSHMRIVDQEQIQQSGQNNVRDVLIHQGAVP